MRLVPEGSVEDPCDCVVVDHWVDAGSSLLPKEMIAGSVHGRVDHRSLDTERAETISRAVEREG